MIQPLTRSEIVSSERDRLILVDARDREIGQLDKSACHDGDGVLHRAFSLFVFNSAGELLIQRRAAGKRLWPGYWSNSCCSHPRSGETMREAVARRLAQELGLGADLEFLYKFEYQARYRNLGAEHELCWVYLGRSDAEPVVNTTEIDDWCWITAERLNAALDEQGDRYTPWFKLEWQHLLQHYPDRLAELGVILPS